MVTVAPGANPPPVSFSCAPPRLEMELGVIPVTCMAKVKPPVRVPNSPLGLVTVTSTAPAGWARVTQVKDCAVISPTPQA
jgi:hypothetical protein